MIITGKDEAEHLNLDAILGRLAEYGLRVNLVKYQIFKDRVSNCGLDLHQGHIGVVKIKTLAILSHAWWPGIDRDIELLSNYM